MEVCYRKPLGIHGEKEGWLILIALLRVIGAAGMLALFCISSPAEASFEEECAKIEVGRPPFNSDPPIFDNEEVRGSILGPIKNGISLYVPDLPEQPLIKCGFVDVTKPPFNADPKGGMDATKALNEAVEFARVHMLVAYVPPGTYVVSDTIECSQGLYQREGHDGERRIAGDRNGACVMMGAMAGVRPTIRLAPNAPGFDDPSHPKYLIHFWARQKNGENGEQPSISFNQKIIGLNLVFGKGNAGAIAIRHRGAQGSVIQDVKIDAKEGYGGIEGGLGSGGSMANVEIDGGQIGLDLSRTQVVSTLVGVALRGQKRFALLFGTRNSLVATGLEIEVPAGVTGPAIRAKSPQHSPLNQLVFKDSVITFASGAENATAISSNRSVYLNNVYVRNAAVILADPAGVALGGAVDTWRHVKEYAHAIQPPLPARGPRSYPYETSAYLNGRNLGDDDLVVLGEDGTLPPSDIRTRHLWDSDFPSWRSDGVANVKAPPYNAVGDGEADDGGAIQAAIDENEIVFLPKGYFRVDRPLVLRPETKLVGADLQLSVLLPSEAGVFGRSEAPMPIVETANSSNAATVLAFLGILSPSSYPQSYALKFQSGPKSIIRSVGFLRHAVEESDAISNHPFVEFSGNAGGKVYNFDMGSWIGHGPHYRHLSIVDTSGLPIAFYALNPEHARSEANMEVRNADNVSIYGLKGEGNHPILWVHDSDQFELFGYGGNASAFESWHAFPEGFATFPPTLIRIQNTPNFRLAGLIDGMRTGGGSDNRFGGRGIPPDNWHFLLETTPTGRWLLSEPLQRPTAYIRTIENGQ